jgi:hypothetical protein
MKQSLIYSLKVWLTSAAIAPALYFVIGLIKEFFHSTAKGLHPMTDFLMLPLLYIFIVVCSCVVSLPTLGVFYATVAVLKKATLTPNYLLAMTLLVAELLVVATFISFIKLFPGFDANTYYILMACTCFVIGVSIWFYRDKHREVRQVTDTVEPTDTIQSNF